MNAKLNTIEALLAKAERTENDAEREAYMAKATELMIRHGIDAAMLDSTRGDKPAEAIIRDTMEFRGQWAHAEQLGFARVATGFNDSIKAFVSQKTQTNRTLHLVGFESDIAAVKVLIASLQMQALNAMATWWSREGRYNYYNRFATTTDQHQQLMHKRSFLQGFYATVAARLRDLRTVVVAEQTAGTELVLVGRKAKVDEWVAGNMRTGAGRSRGLAGGAGRAAGAAAGARADIGGTRVGGAAGRSIAG